MIASRLAGLLARPWGWTALQRSAVALAVILFLLSLRRAGERAGRMAERLETMEKSNDAHRRMLEAAARRPRSCDDLARRLRDGGSEPGIVAVCPPVVEYGPKFQARTADELALLPEESAVAKMLSDYAVTREQARACASQ